jgi:hypothetical protein
MKLPSTPLTLLLALGGTTAGIPTMEIKSCAQGGVTVTDFKACATPLGQPDVPAAQVRSASRASFLRSSLQHCLSSSR